MGDLGHARKGRHLSRRRFMGMSACAAAGLVVAVPLSAFYAYFVLAIDRFVLEMEGSSSELVDELMDIEYRKTTGQPSTPGIKS